MNYRDDPRWIDAQERFVAPMADDETPEESFARCIVAAYEMWLVQKGHEVPSGLNKTHALIAYGFLAGPDELERAMS